MMKKVTVISTSLRAGSNSETLAQEFARGAAEAGHSVTSITLAGKRLEFCRGCLACQKLGRCVVDDDANAIAEQVLASDVVVFATPVYYYGMSGQMKTLLDRMNSLYPKDYRFRDVYLVASAAEDTPQALERTMGGLTGWVECFEKARLAGVVQGHGNSNPGDVKSNPAQLAAAYAAGAAV